ncbi:hypothetical protein BX600DRAFT_455978 [Xylariales sp. PMI_506]|nr:hypothetical protein BX600DRAFT_455978 [Xylariales sp. PMI_506]
MAKSSRASTRKTNNQRLKAKVFGPVEAARIERLSSKLLELAAQPKPPKPESEEMKIIDDEEDNSKVDEVVTNEDAAMDVDTAKPTESNRSHKKRIEKRKKPSKIVFAKRSDRLKKRKN